MASHWRIEQVAVHFDVSVSTVRRWIAAGRLRAIKAGGLRVPADEIDRFARERRRERA